MSEALNKTRDFIISAMGEGKKTYTALDGSSRPEYIYQAPLHAAHGNACLVTQYEYYTTTTTVKKTKEYVGTWDSSYDI